MKWSSWTCSQVQKSFDRAFCREQRFRRNSCSHWRCGKESTGKFIEDGIWGTNRGEARYVKKNVSWNFLRLTSRFSTLPTSPMRTVLVSVNLACTDVEEDHTARQTSRMKLRSLISRKNTRIRPRIYVERNKSTVQYPVVLFGLSSTTISEWMQETA